MMTNLTSHNEVVLEGQVLTAPIPSHENHGSRFYRFTLQVPRLSGQADVLSIVIPEALLCQVVLES